MRPARFVLLAGAAFAALTTVAVLALVVRDARPPDRPAEAAAASAIGGPFAMTDERGRRFTQADLQGTPTVLFFGFTYCPDVCPTTLFELTALVDELGGDGEALQVVMVSVDPERDTPEILHEYVTAFRSDFRALTGTPEELAQIAKAYRVQYERRETPSGYTMDHTASVYLLDREGTFAGTITLHEDRATALGKLRRLIETA